MAINIISSFCFNVRTSFMVVVTMEYGHFSDISDDELLEATQAAEYLNEIGFEDVDIQPTNVPPVSYLSDILHRFLELALKLVKCSNSID